MDEFAHGDAAVWPLDQASVSLASLVPAAQERIDLRAAGRRDPAKVPTGLPYFDSLLGGLPPSCLVVLSSDHGAMLDSLLGQLALSLSQTMPVGYVSTMLEATALTEHLARLRTGQPAPEATDTDGLAQHQLHILDKSGITLACLVTCIRHWVRYKGVRAVVIDDWRAIRVGTADRLASTDTVVACDKAEVIWRLAHELGIIVIAGSLDSRLGGAITSHNTNLRWKLQSPLVRHADLCAIPYCGAMPESLGQRQAVQLYIIKNRTIGVGIVECAYDGVRFMPDATI